MRTIIGIAAVTLFAATAAAQSTRRTDFRGDPATEAATAVEVNGLTALKGLRQVYIPQFTVEFVEKSDGLSSQEEKRQDYVYIDYRVAGLGAAEQQAITDRLYARWKAALEARGLTVAGPDAALATKAGGKLAKNLKPAPALLKRSSGQTRIYSAGATTYLMPRTAMGEAPTEGQATASAAADTGAAVGSKVGGKLGGMFGMARGLGKMGSGLSNFGGAWNYAAQENAMAKETGAAVMTVRLVVGLRDIDMAGRGFGLFRSAGSYDGKPRLVVMGDASEVAITAPDGKRATVSVPRDLVFQEDVLAGKLRVDNSTGATVSNVASKAMFATAAVGGGSATVNQRHSFTATPEPAAYAAAVERNMSAVEDIFLKRLGEAW